MDPRDEALFERYFAAQLGAPFTSLDTVAQLAREAVAKHRALFPLPVAVQAAKEEVDAGGGYLCELCGGSGQVAWNDPEDCATCDGSGIEPGGAQ